MWSKYTVSLLLVVIKSRLIYGQCGNKFYRKDFIYKEDMDSFLKINTVFKTWSEARKNCIRDGATLFYPEDEYEAMAVIALWNDKHPRFQKIWIGVANWNIRDSYQTIDGRDISEVYENWMFNEPDDFEGNEGCVVLQGDGTLKDEFCGKNYGYLCKKTPESFEWDTECALPYKGYIYNKDLQRCYKFHLTPENWTDAYSVCKSEQSYLAIINSQTEADYLKKITDDTNKEKYIIGFLRGAVHLGFLNKNGYWETIDGVPLHYSGFGNGWAYNQPDGGEIENCGSIFYSGELNDIGCFHRMFFICEHEIDSRIVEAYNITTELLCTKSVRNTEKYAISGELTQACYFAMVILAAIISSTLNDVYSE